MQRHPVQRRPTEAKLFDEGANQLEMGLDGMQSGAGMDVDRTVLELCLAKMRVLKSAARMNLAGPSIYDEISVAIRPSPEVFDAQSRASLFDQHIATVERLLTPELAGPPDPVALEKAAIFMRQLVVAFQSYFIKVDRLAVQAMGGSRNHSGK